MDSSERAELILFVVCVVLNALVSAAETALVSSRRSRINTLVEEGRPTAAHVQRILDKPERFLASIQAFVTALIATGTVAATLLFLRWFGPSSLPRTLLAGLAAYAIFLLFGVILPKSVARRHSEGAAMFLVRPVSWMTFLVFPLIQVVIIISNLLVRLIPGQHPMSRHPYVTEEEIKVLVEKGEELGELEEDEREMVTAIFDLDRRVVREVMVPRVDVVSVDVDMPLDDVIDVIAVSGHTRVPVSEGNLDNVLGVLHAKDLLRYLRHGSHDFSIRNSMRPAPFVPENKNAKDLLEEMRDRRTPFAVVVDEYGGTAGIITLEDLIEEIVGEIRDEYDVEEDAIVRLADNAALVDGKASIADVNDELEINIPTEEYDSIGGFVMGLFGRVPALGDEAKWENVNFTVDGVSPNRVRRVRVTVERKKNSEQPT